MNCIDYFKVAVLEFNPNDCPVQQISMYLRQFFDVAE